MMNNNPHVQQLKNQNDLPFRNELEPETMNIVAALENLFNVVYPTMPQWQDMEVGTRKLLNEISRLVIGYHFHATTEDVPDFHTITAWLGFGLHHIPSLETLILKMQQPRIQNAMCVNGLATFTVPNLTMNMANPTPKRVTLHEPSNTYIVNSDEKSAHIFSADNFVQAQLMISANHTPIPGILSYNVTFKFGKEGNLLETFGAADPFAEPTNLVAIHYNARGAALLSFRSNLRDLVDEYHPMIIIITETRLGPTEAEQVGIELGYMELVYLKPVGCCGGVWVFSNEASLSLHHIAVGDESIWVNLLKV